MPSLGAHLIGRQGEFRTPPAWRASACRSQLREAVGIAIPAA